MTALDTAFAQKLSAHADRLLDLIDRFGQSRVMVIGDLTLDEFLTGQVERLSREAPVLILRHEHTRQVPGGGANAIYNFAKLGAQVKAVGLLGNDPQGEVLRGIFEAAGIDTQGLLVERDRPTVTKTRISGHARQSVTQQIVRVDRKSDEMPALQYQQQLADYVRSQIQSVDAVICSDYGDGVLSAPVIDAAIGHGLSIVDAQTDLHRFAGASLFTPNLPEAEKAVGFSVVRPSGGTDPDLIRKAGYELLKTNRAQHILITRGEDGMSLFSADGSEDHIPAFNRTDVFDVTGAGDTVVAGLTLALTLGASPWEAIVLGNLAASLVVRQFGTATTSQSEMKSALQLLLEEN